jgi:hypothetical protein
VELVDALASGASGLTAVKVRVLSWAPNALAHDLRKMRAVWSASRCARPGCGGSELAESAVVIVACISAPSLQDSAPPVSEPGQLPGKQPATETSINFQPIVMRKEQKLPSGLCCDQSVPAKFKGKLYRLG